MADGELLDIVPTRAMLQKGAKTVDFKATVFDTKSRNSLKSIGPKPPHTAEHQQKPNYSDDEFGEDFDDDLSEQKRRKPKRKDDTEFDMKRARHEVIRFGSSGFETQDKKRAQIALAVKLGARPPRNEYKNYKDLIAEKRQAKAQKESEQRMLQLGKNQVGVASVRCQPKKGLQKRRRDLGDISQHYGVTKPKLFKKKKRRN
ncbi:uncharacterized protein C1orf131 homolog [Hermetia illucens]|nr:uncharacterized protein C1orf131 homolog [Hermetia illucens]XP_037917264.1 uncharacterized protein C1orf131 homolog [Hermetia illucens]